MTSPDEPDDLESRLLALGESLDVPAPPPTDVAAAVRARLEALPSPQRHPLPTSTDSDAGGTASPEAASSDAASPGAGSADPVVPDAASPEADPSGSGDSEPSDPDASGPASPAPGPSRPARGSRRPRGFPPAPVRRAGRTARPGARVRRRVVVAVVAVMVALFFGATPVGRAAVAEILRFAGIELRIGGDPGPLPSGVPSPLPGEERVTLQQARERVVFPVGVPAALGEPQDVRVSDGGRVVSMLWPGVRLDQYDGTLDVVFRKELGEPWPEDAVVGNSHAWWIPAKHALTYRPRAGGPEVESRLSGSTLIWQRGQVGLRLEGPADLARAREIAESVR
ncbi:hypothetical protein ACFFMN_10050 [Planobispora siamensis]|uniref:DUF4367 domain-containing protein n=1 Tax=Planobispora siamensis TaxID=936338 RepID=A0A8J3SKK1_9ACTN|nr:hypothetical protein [Planobispora siamensis]GIH91333.1 hypothetical protein Psi01_19630 [Planobispora siamensis]